MNSWLDKKAYNDARYGAGGFPGYSEAAGSGKGQQRPKNFWGDVFKLRTPSVVVIVLSMVYGGYAAALTHADCSEVAHQAFKIAFADITQSWGEIASSVGLSGNSFLTSIVEFIAVVASLIFALFSGAGGLIVYAFMTLLHG
jgi:hypothetical protein